MAHSCSEKLIHSQSTHVLPGRYRLKEVYNAGTTVLITPTVIVVQLALCSDPKNGMLSWQCARKSPTCDEQALGIESATCVVVLQGSLLLGCEN